MKNNVLSAVLLLCCIFVFPGASCRIGREGLAIDPVRPSGHAVVYGTIRKIGIQVEQNQLNGTPSANIGFQSLTFGVLPVSTTNLYTVPIKAGVGAGTEGFGVDITETFESYEKVPGK